MFNVRTSREDSGHMRLPTFYQVSEQSFQIQPQHRLETFVVDHLVGAEYTICIKSDPNSAEVLSEALVKVSDQKVSIRHHKGEPLNLSDHQFISELPRLFSFLGMDSAEHTKFNDLFYGVFWDAVPLKA